MASRPARFPGGSFALRQSLSTCNRRLAMAPRHAQGTGGNFVLLQLMETSINRRVLWTVECPAAAAAAGLDHVVESLLRFA